MLLQTPGPNSCGGKKHMRSNLGGDSQQYEPTIPPQFPQTLPFKCGPRHGIFIEYPTISQHAIFIEFHLFLYTFYTAVQFLTQRPVME